MSTASAAETEKVNPVLAVIGFLMIVACIPLSIAIHAAIYDSIWSMTVATQYAINPTYTVWVGVAALVSVTTTVGMPLTEKRGKVWADGIMDFTTTALARWTGLTIVWLAVRLILAVA